MLTLITPYLIEIRLMGETKHLTKKFIYDLFYRFKVRGQVRTRSVPHVTLFGPFGCKSIRQVIHTMGEIGSEYRELEYGVDGFDYFELKKKFLFVTTSTKKNAIYLKIIPSKELEDFRSRLAKNCSNSLTIQVLLIAQATNSIFMRQLDSKTLIANLMIYGST